MSNILDEVDDILGDMDANDSETEVSDSAEKSFNDSELQDIMAEIENLEKEFDNENSIENKIQVEEKNTVAEMSMPPEKTDLQSEIDRELEMSLEMRDKMITPTEKTPNVLTFDKKSQNSEISFEAQGQMILNLGFKIGDESAKLSIDPVKGLMITMSGVELCINQQDGCKVTMESGVKMTIPLKSPNINQNKKSA